MISQLHIPFRRYSINRWAVVLIIAYSIIMLYALKTYIIWQSVNVLLGVIALPFVTVLSPQKSIRFALLALVPGILSFWLPVKTMLYSTIVCAGFFIVESFAGKINLLPWMVVAMMSPVFQYVTNIFSFPIRLQLTDWAGHIMNMAGMETEVAGNMIYHNGNEFSVDPACMGLNMIVTALLIQVLLIAIYQKRYLLRLVWWQVPVLLAVISMLNIIANLFRIVCLVQFNILPDAVMHEATGIICFVAYVIVPAAFITRFAVKRFGRNNPDSNTAHGHIPVKKMGAWHGLVLAVTLGAGYSVTRFDERMNDTTAMVVPVTGYSVQRISADIVKLENAHSLVYIKTIPGFYNSDHSPMICWRGSGYAFRQVEKKVIAGIPVYMGMLQNGNDQLYTAWWYDNGTKRTIEQLNWRWDVLTGARRYAIVNVTSPEKQRLSDEVKGILTGNRLQPLLQSTNK